MLGTVGGKTVLRQDVALFARAVNPFNKEATVTIVNAECTARGNLGAIRALTDPKFRGRNVEYLAASVPGQPVLLHPQPRVRSSAAGR